MLTYAIFCAIAWLLVLAVAPTTRVPFAIVFASRLALAVMGLLFVTAPTVCDFTRARPRMAKLQIANLQEALVEYRRVYGFYPDTAVGLDALVKTGLLKRVPLDPWDGRYEYSMYGSHYVLRSFGADHRFGGTGQDADVDRFVVLDDRM